MNSDTDVFVIGGGPAGLAAALAARRRGLRVIVADGRRPPIDKACGEGLMPDSLAAADRIGIGLPDGEGFRFRGIRFHGDNHSIAADFPSGYGIGIRRVALHTHMVRLAAAAGVEMLWSTPVSGIDPAGVHAGRRRFSTGWIVGADGFGSRAGRWAGLDRFVRDSRRFAYRRHFAIQPWTDFMEIYWENGCQIYVTPVSPEEVCVAFISRSANVRLAEALPRFPDLHARLSGAPPSSGERGAVTATSRREAVVRGNVVLVGDASGSADAITGEGLCQAFQQAEALAEAFVRRDLSYYAARHRRIAFRPALMADLMLTLVRWPGIRRRAFQAMDRRPQCFASMLAAHVGSRPAMHLAGAGLSLGWQMICG
ncbi:MAG TPA: FAD-dependent monooxygenase [Bryobacteraceae bacterium]|nr:FAD-dependent monooxygenase [Bryobacteraceae bacterium]